MTAVTVIGSGVVEYAVAGENRIFCNSGAVHAGIDSSGLTVAGQVAGMPGAV